MSLDGLFDILKKVRQKYPSLSKRITESEALNRWDLAVGPAIAKHARALRIKNSVLWVEVDHPIWKSELHYRKQQILEILNKGAEQTQILEDLLLLDRGRGYHSN